MTNRLFSWSLGKSTETYITEFTVGFHHFPLQDTECHCLRKEHRPPDTVPFLSPPWSCRVLTPSGLELSLLGDLTTPGSETGILVFESQPSHLAMLPWASALLSQSLVSHLKNSGSHNKMSVQKCLWRRTLPTTQLHFYLGLRWDLNSRYVPLSIQGLWPRLPRMQLPSFLSGALSTPFLTHAGAWNHFPAPRPHRRLEKCKAPEGANCMKPITHSLSHSPLSLSLSWRVCRTLLGLFLNELPKNFNK